MTTPEFLWDQAALAERERDEALAENWELIERIIKLERAVDVLSRDIEALELENEILRNKIAKRYTS